MKNYDLERIVPIMRDCQRFFDDLTLAYRVQGIKITDRFKKLRKDVTEQIIKIEGEDNEERR